MYRSASDWLCRAVQKPCAIAGRQVRPAAGQALPWLRRNLHVILALTIALRSSIAIWFACGAAFVRFGGQNPQGFASPFVEYILTGPLWVGVPWAIYIYGYVVSAVLIWNRRFCAVATYSAAFIIDLSLWTYVSLDHRVEYSAGQWTMFNNNLLNLVDLCMVAVLLAYLNGRPVKK